MVFVFLNVDGSDNELPETEDRMIIMFANKLGLTTQVPMVYEVCSNKATTEYRDMQIGNFRMII